MELFSQKRSTVLSCLSKRFGVLDYMKFPLKYFYDMRHRLGLLVSNSGLFCIDEIKFIIKETS